MNRDTKQFWWLDVLIPLFLSASVVGGLSYLVYSGQKHRRISSEFEESFIAFSLKQAGTRKSLNSGESVIVSLKENEREKWFSGGKNILPLSVVLKSVKASIDAGGAEIFVHLPLERSPSDADKSSLIQLIESHPNTQFRLMVPYKLIGFLGKEIPKNLLLLDLESCFGETQVMCSYHKEWDDWIPQYLINRSQTKVVDGILGGITSDNLPRPFPSYLIHLNDRRDFEEYSFSEILVPSSGISFKGKSVFIGYDLWAPSGEGDYYSHARVNTPSTLEIDERGLPYHLFWASLNQIALDGGYVIVVNRLTTWVISAVFVVFILAILIFFGAPFSLGGFLVFAALAPFVNAFSISHFSVYIPLFDVIYAGVATFFFASFGKFSLDAYGEWWRKVSVELQVEAEDLKGNFISLVSHNLNTPVAKMQGMIGILRQYSSSQETKEKAKEAARKVSEIQYCIRGVLTAAALDEGRINHEAMNLSLIQSEFEAQVMKMLQDIGYQVSVELEDPEDENNLIPLRFDKKAITLGIASLVSFVELAESCQVLLKCREDDQGDYCLRVTVNGLILDHAWFKEFIEDNGRNTEIFSATESDLTLFQEVSLGMMKAVNQIYSGKLHLDIADQGGLVLHGTFCPPE